VLVLESRENAVAWLHVALKVPLAILTKEWNCLLSPLYADFRRFRMRMPQPFNFDQRVARLSRRAGPRCSG
jgi:hypothetical protein